MVKNKIIPLLLVQEIEVPLSIAGVIFAAFLKNFKTPPSTFTYLLENFNDFFVYIIFIHKHLPNIYLTNYFIFFFYFQEIQVTDNPILIKRESGCLKTYFYVHEQFEESSYDIFTNEELREKFLHIRLQTRLPLICELNEQSIKEAMQTLSRKVIDL